MAYQVEYQSLFTSNHNGFVPLWASFRVEYQSLFTSNHNLAAAMPCTACFTGLKRRAKTVLCLPGSSSNRNFPYSILSY